MPVPSFRGGLGGSGIPVEVGEGRAMWWDEDWQEGQEPWLRAWFFH